MIIILFSTKVQTVCTCQLQNIFQLQSLTETRDVIILQRQRRQLLFRVYQPYTNTYSFSHPKANVNYPKIKLLCLYHMQLSVKDISIQFTLISCCVVVLNRSLYIAYPPLNGSSQSCCVLSSVSCRLVSSLVVSFKLCQLFAPSAIIKVLKNKLHQSTKNI